MRAFVPRRSWSLATLLVGAAVSLSCGGDGGTPSPTPTNVVVTPGADTLISIGENQAFTATVLDANGDPIDGATVTWSSDAPSVVSIDATSGVATAVTRGSAHVTATAGDLQGSAAIFVTQIVTSVTVTPGNVALDGVGDTVRFTAVAKDSGGTVVGDAQVVWSVNDNTVATIDTLGLATAKGPGVVLVTALAQTRAGYAALGVTQSPATIVFTALPASGTAGEYFPTAIQVEIRDSNGHRVRNAQLPVTVSVAGGAGPFGMVGVNVITTIDGVTNFPTLGVTRAGDLQLTASAPGLAPGVSAPIPVAAAQPAQLAVLSLKDTMVAGDTLVATIAVQDRFGNQTQADGVGVDLTLQRVIPGPSTDTTGLYGYAHAVSIDGIIDQFQARAIRADTGWTLVVTSPGYDPVTGGSATVLPNVPAATTMFFTGIEALSPWIGVGLPRSDGMTALITDQWGNWTPSAPSTALTVELVSWVLGTPADTSLQQALIGSVSLIADSGRVAFPDLGLRRPGSTSLQVTGGGYLPLAASFVGRIFGKHGLVAGGKHACLLADAGTYCWGDNAAGEISGSGASDSVARAVASTPALVSLVAGDRHTCGLTAGGQAWCWGANESGQLGRNSTSAAEPVPGVVVTGITFSVLSAGGSHTCGIGLADSVAYCWGANADQQLGDSTSTPRSVPTPVVGGGKYQAIAAGYRHTCAIEAVPLRTARCWGRNIQGEGGMGTDAIPVLMAPTLVLGDSFTVIRAGDGFTCAEVRSPVIDGLPTVKCWGRDDLAQMGYDSGTIDHRPSPETVLGVDGVRAGTLAVGTAHSCVIDRFGQLRCWGYNAYHQIQNNAFTVFETAVVPALAGAWPAGTVVATGADFTCVSAPPSGFGATVGDTRCWGAGAKGQLGDGGSHFTPSGPVLAAQ